MIDPFLKGRGRFFSTRRSDSRTRFVIGLHPYRYRKKDTGGSRDTRVPVRDTPCRTVNQSSQRSEFKRRGG
jgi:hypothetical protein